MLKFLRGLDVKKAACAYGRTNAAARAYLTMKGGWMQLYEVVAILDSDAMFKCAS